MFCRPLRSSSFVSTIKNSYLIESNYIKIKRFETSLYNSACLFKEEFLLLPNWFHFLLWFFVSYNFATWHFHHQKLAYCRHKGVDMVEHGDEGTIVFKQCFVGTDGSQCVLIKYFPILLDQQQKPQSLKELKIPAVILFVPNPVPAVQMLQHTLWLIRPGNIFFILQPNNLDEAM